MTKILFVCHGNICRSPMAEYVMRDIVRKAGCEARFEIASAATSSEEIGNDVYPPARRELTSHGVDCPSRAARRLTRRDFDDFDMLIGMDEENLRDMRRIGGPGSENKTSLLMDFTGRPGSVADPWYTRDFGAAWRDISLGCRALFEKLTADS